MNIIKAKGFTLLETLVSVGILALVIVGPLAAIMNSSSYARQTKDAMVATYLAEEAIELLQNQYDSLYVYCKKNSGVDPCNTTGSETAGQTAWRVFKERLNAGGGQPSCFLSGHVSDPSVIANPDGCSYDFEHLIGDITVNPTRYVSSDDECLYLVGASTTIPIYVRHGETYQLVDVIKHRYVCNGARHYPSDWLSRFDRNC
jgi:prepilin-type N-terminal cleavage/methylation domain-containing protein